MTETLAVAVPAGLAAALAAMAFAAPARRAARAAVLALALAAAGAAAWGALALLGRPQPASFALAAAAAPWLEVAFADWAEGEGIHVLLRDPEGGAPRLYVLPWRRERAEELAAAAARARRQGGALRMANVLGAGPPGAGERRLAGRALFSVAMPPPEGIDPVPAGSAGL